MKRYVVGFGRFWWEFFVADTPELTVGVLAVLGIAFGVRSWGVAAAVIIPAAVVALLLVSVQRGRAH
ncbi:MAG: hypothetical protein EXR47_07345 [Dehalococcoidia bacterium]|nr:hypothetical protein [Dehalococcoidia bacterium]